MTEKTSQKKRQIDHRKNHRIYGISFENSFDPDGNHTHTLTEKKGYGMNKHQ